MRTLWVAFAGAVLFGTVCAHAALDFTLQRQTTVNDAVSVQGTYITDGASKIFLRVPEWWKVADTAAAIECVPEVANSRVRLESFTGDKPLTLDDAGARALAQMAQAQIPKEGVNVAVVSAELNPLPIFGWQTMEVVLRYDLFGQAMRRSLLYVYMMPGRAVNLTVVGPETDFLKLHKEARQILSSWFEPSRDLPPDLQRKFESAQAGS